MTGPLDAAAVAKQLPDVGEGLAAQFANLSRVPTLYGCEVLASNLDGARRLVLRFREEMLVSGDSPDA